MVKIESLKNVEATQEKKLSAIELELKTQEEILDKLSQKKDSERTQLDKESKLAAEAEIKRVEAQKRLSALEE
jgi:hypothetical protein